MDFEKIREIVANQLDIDPEEITPEKSFAKDFEADSLDVVEIAMALEDEMGISIPDEEFENIKTVGDAMEVINRLTNN